MLKTAPDALGYRHILQRYSRNALIDRLLFAVKITLVPIYHDFKRFVFLNL